MIATSNGRFRFVRPFPGSPRSFKGAGRLQKVDGLAKRVVIAEAAIRP
jgi:hypothetical protein